MRVDCLMHLPAAAFRDQHLQWLLDITQIPTAAGREWRVVAWLRAWVAQRPDLEIIADDSGNLVVQGKPAWSSGGGPGRSPVFFTAHMDHPAFVVERIVAPGVVELAFRGGVMDIYFENARVVVHSGGRDNVPAQVLRAVLKGKSSPPGAPFPHYIADLEAGATADAVRVGDVAVWDFPPADVDAQGLVHTHACDDLAALAAALAAFDTLRSLRAAGQTTEDVCLLFTRSEEIGFTGAIAACRLGTMTIEARVIALENSRAFADSPVGSGPIVRVGDRMSIFDPRLTASCAKKAEELAGGGASAAGWKWQRKLMAGGACEATVFCAFGYKATCLCLPLGNYHNMADLAAVQDGTHDASASGPPRVAREFIHRDDYFGLIDLLVAIGRDLPEGDPAMPRIEKLYENTAHVLKET